MVKDRKLEFEGLKFNILMKMKSIKQIKKPMKYIRVRSVIYKIDSHRASSGGHF